MVYHDNGICSEMPTDSTDKVVIHFTARIIILFDYSRRRAINMDQLTK
jgi:hypothetical protein